MSTFLQFLTIIYSMLDISITFGGFSFTYKDVLLFLIIGSMAVRLFVRLFNMGDR